MEIPLIFLVVIIAGGIGTMTGFGTSTIMVPVMLLFYPVPQTLFFVGIIHFSVMSGSFCCSAKACGGG